MNKYGNTNSFIIIFGSGHFSGREVRERSSSVTTHRIPRNVTSMFYESVIIQFPISQLDIKRVCQQYFNHVQTSAGNGERINGYERKVSSFLPPPHMFFFLRRKTVECHTDHISLANHHLKSRHISHEQRLKLRKQQ